MRILARYPESILTLVLVALAGTLAACAGYGAWLRETAAARPHLLGRTEGTHRVAIVDTGRAALDHRIRSFRDAQRSIQIQTFILDDQPTTRLQLNELVQAARRGVRVQLLADCMFTAKLPHHVARLAAAHPNLEIKLFGPESRDLAAGLLASLGVAVTDWHRLNHRMHNKLIVVDGELGICGGRNFQDSYFDEDPRLNYRDRDVAVTGPVVERMEQSFAAYWRDQHSVAAASLRDVAAELSAAERAWPFTLEELGVAALAQKVERCLRKGAPKLRWHVVSAIAFWTDGPAKLDIDEAPGCVAERLIGALGNAQHDVLIQSPYMVLTDAAMELFASVRDRGVDVKVHTNSLASTDNWPSYAHAMRQRRQVLEGLDLEIYEMMPFPGHLNRIVPRTESLRSAVSGRGPMLSLHAKSMVVDGELSVIGSYNLDPRSEVLNTEVLLAVWDRAFARELTQAIHLDAGPANSWVVASRQRSLPRAVVAEIFAQLNAVVKGATTFDVWPFAWSSQYELRPGYEPVSRRHPEFYTRYRAVGAFPGVDDLGTKLLVRLAKALTGIARPLM